MTKSLPNIGAEVRLMRLIKRRFPKGCTVILNEKGKEQGLCALREEPVLGTVFSHASRGLLRIIIGNSAPEPYHYTFWDLI
jgi:hypothetical protein